MTAHHFCHIIFLQSESPDLYSKGWANSRAQLPGVGDYWSCFRAACHSFHLLIYTTAITILSSCRFIYLFIYLAASGLRCSTQNLHCGMWDLPLHLKSSSTCDVQAPELLGSAVVTCGLSCPMAWGLSVPRTGICSRDQTCVPALEGGFLTTGPPGKSLTIDLDSYYLDR